MKKYIAIIVLSVFVISCKSKAVAVQNNTEPKEISPKEEKKVILNYAQDYTTRNSINFTNVHKERTNPDKKSKLWDVENLSASYAFTKFSHRDFINENTLQKTYRASLAYTYTGQPAVYQPFD